MRKFLTYAMMSAAALTLMTSCSQDDFAPVEGDGNVNFTVQLPASLETKAFGEGTFDKGDQANRLYYAVYQVDGTAEAPTYTMISTEAYEKDINMRTDVSLKLVNGKTYTVIFFARNGDFTAVTPDWTNRTMAVDYSGMTRSSEVPDAFYATETFTVTGPLQKDVTLRRPFAQVNFGSNDLSEDAVKAAFGDDLASLTTKLTLKAPVTFDFISGEPAGEAEEISYTAAAVPASTERFPVDGYRYLSMDYILAGRATGSITDMKFSVMNGETEYNAITVNAAPVQANYRTNIYGQLLTSDADFNVVIEPAFNTPDYDKDLITKEMTWAEFCEEKGIKTGYNDTGDIVADGKNQVIITDWVDAWYTGNLTVRNLTFKHGATFTAKDNNAVGTILIENNTFGPCDWYEIEADLTESKYLTSDGKNIRNAGGGLCLNIDTKNSPELDVIVRNNVMEGANDATLPRDYSIDMINVNNKKARGHAVAINAIAGGGTAKSVVIDGNEMTGILGNAIQLYTFNYPITVSNNKINSWAINKSPRDSAIRGTLGTTGTLTLENNYFGLNETFLKKHVNVDNYTGNTDGKREAGTY